MKISSIQKNTSSFYNSKVKQNTPPNTAPIKNTNLLGIKNSSNVSFTSGSYKWDGWDIGKLDILGRSKYAMEELGEYFHESSAGIIEEASTIRHWLLGYKKNEKSQIAHDKLKSAVNEVKKYKQQILKDLSELKKKSSLSTHELNYKIKIEKDLPRMERRAESLYDEFGQWTSEADPMDDHSLY